MVNDRWEGTSRAPTAGQAPPRGGQPSGGTQRPSLDRKERGSLPRGQCPGGWKSGRQRGGGAQLLSAGDGFLKLRKIRRASALQGDAFPGKDDKQHCHRISKEIVNFKGMKQSIIYTSAQGSSGNFFKIRGQEERKEHLLNTYYVPGSVLLAINM